MIWCLLALWHIWHVQPRIGEEITCDTCSSREAGATCEPCTSALALAISTKADP